MAKQIDFKEYSRIRDIVQKRIKRAVQAGLAPMVHVPTVKEIKAGIVDPRDALRALQGYYSSGSQVKTIRQTGLVPEFKSFPTLPPEKKLSQAEKKERTREYQRDYRRRKKILSSAKDEKERKSLLQTIKAVKTVEKIWKKAGKDLGIYLSELSPKEAKAFIEYIQYRFSQGDFTQVYVIDQFIQDYKALNKKGYYTKDEIQRDFEKFLENRHGLNIRATSMEGVTPEELDVYWSEFVE